MKQSRFKYILIYYLNEISKSLFQPLLIVFGETMSCVSVVQCGAKAPQHFNLQERPTPRK